MILAEGEIVIGNVRLRGKAGGGGEVFDAGHLSSSLYFAHSGYYILPIRFIWSTLCSESLDK